MSILRFIEHILLVLFGNLITYGNYIYNQLSTEKESTYVKRQNMKQGTNIQLIFILEVKLQKEHFSQKQSFFS